MTIDEIKNDILSKTTTAVSMAQEEVYAIIESVLKDFYDDFTPVMYKRTWQLLHSCVKSSVRTTANGVEADVYFDTSLMTYNTGNMPSGEQVIEAANKAQHGAEGLHVEYGYVKLFPDSERLVMSEIMPIMKTALIKAGIPVK